MRKKKVQQKLREELTLEIFPSSSLTLHGTREERLRERKAEEKGRRGQREERSFSILHLVPVSSSPSLKISIGPCHIGSILSNLLPFSSLSPASSLLTFISFPPLVLRLHITYIPPMFLLYTLPIPSHMTFSHSSTSLVTGCPPRLCPPFSLLSIFVFCHSLFISPSCDGFPSCITCPSPHLSSPSPCYSSSSFPCLHSLLTT